MTSKIISFEFIKDYEVRISFDDGQKFEIDLAKYLGKGFARELLDKKKFGELYIEPGGGLAWPNGYDICPVFLRNIVDKEKSELST
ncbi:DUF2442 domain-containing protein [Aequorivita sp. H23M31]|uniref:DUF2442 domain-containing protein n=1 Tax=Aequorivita ciconiae TaxID=2494375 RepID=A0A410G349_9FLAO|nr:DUF2442 domain-containing protein [Aequorivita sp. H23M31]QAA81702.1 DUF2442 domain-containing protein [Aequorivita sp. H23M31]